MPLQRRRRHSHQNDGGIRTAPYDEANGLLKVTNLSFLLRPPVTAEEIRDATPHIHDVINSAYDIYESKGIASLVQSFILLMINTIHNPFNPCKQLFYEDAIIFKHSGLWRRE